MVQEQMLPNPSPRNVDRIWFLVIGVLAVAMVLFGILGYLQLKDGKDAAALFGLVGTALGGIAGLLAPSPISK